MALLSPVVTARVLVGVWAQSLVRNIMHFLVQFRPRTVAGPAKGVVHDVGQAWDSEHEGREAGGSVRHRSRGTAWHSAHDEPLGDAIMIIPRPGHRVVL